MSHPEPCISCRAAPSFMKAGAPGSGILWKCASCGHEIPFAMPVADTGEDEGVVPMAPGLTVGELRKALEGVPDHLPVTIRMNATDLDGGQVCGGIISAAAEDNCGGLHFAIDGSDDDEDFDE